MINFHGNVGSEGRCLFVLFSDFLKLQFFRITQYGAKSCMRNYRAVRDIKTKY